MKDQSQSRWKVSDKIALAALLTTTAISIGGLLLSIQEKNSEINELEVSLSTITDSIEKLTETNEKLTKEGEQNRGLILELQKLQRKQAAGVFDEYSLNLRSKVSDDSVKTRSISVKRHFESLPDLVEVNRSDPTCFIVFGDEFIPGTEVVLYWSLFDAAGNVVYSRSYESSVNSSDWYAYTCPLELSAQKPGKYEIQYNFAGNRGEHRYLIKQTGG